MLLCCPLHSYVPLTFTTSPIDGLSCLHSQALTEVGVLSDLLQIVKNHHNYIALDPVVQQSSAAVEANPSYQMLAKKKVRLRSNSRKNW